MISVLKFIRLGGGPNSMERPIWRSPYSQLQPPSLTLVRHKVKLYGKGRDTSAAFDFILINPFKAKPQQTKGEVIYCIGHDM